MNEDRYYGSDLNKWIAENCPKTFTTINIDLLLFKRTKGILRIVESKHSSEHMGKSQFEVLKLLAWLFRLANQFQQKIQFEVYIITGDLPYNQVKITDLVKKDFMFFDDSESFKRWIMFEDA